LDEKLTSRALIDHYTRPRNAGSLDRKDPSVGSGLVGAPACGDVIRLDIQVDEATGTIVDARFKTFGCGSAIASSSYLTTLVKGKRCEFLCSLLVSEFRVRRRQCDGRRKFADMSAVEDAAKIKNVDISSELCLPPVKCKFS
jgi:nitrogen fixation NifU-like protein